MTDEIRRAADTTITVALARLVSVIGVPVLLGMLGWVVVSINEMKNALTDLRGQVVYGVSQRVTTAESRLDRIERRLFGEKS